MEWKEAISTAISALNARRMRSLLTMLGILIGIAAVMLTVGLGQGASASITSRINALGSNLIVVTPSQSTSSGGFRGGGGSVSTLTTADATMLADKTVAPDIAAVAPVSSTSGSLQSSSTTWTSTVVGTTPVFAPPYRLDGQRLPIRHAPPTLGEGTREVLHRLLSMSDEQLQQLQSKGVLTLPEPPAQ